MTGSRAHAMPPLRSGRWLAVAIVLILGGLAMAAWTQTRGGISVSDVRFRAADGTTMSALVYRPPHATAATPAPGILAVHGYINTRETQSPFAIEFARRGYVVVALDQRGHGYSGGAATRDGFGGPDGLRYLRSLPFVDRAQIGLEGHSMGGWAILAAAAAYPNAYRAMVLEGSSTGAPYAAEGTATWPRNLAVVYSRFDEFAPLMWNVDRAQDVGRSAKLRALFGVAGTVVADRLYGNTAAGTARLLRTPTATHPGDHLSRAAVGDAIDWFGRTLRGGTGLPASDQIWWIKEAGTGLALIGIAILTFGIFDLLLAMPPFSSLRATMPMAPISPPRRRWWTDWLRATVVPPLTYYAALLVLPPPITPTGVFPQAITNWLMLWALGNVVLALLFDRIPRRSQMPWRQIRWSPAIAIAIVTIGTVYVVVAAAAWIPADVRFWVVAVRPMNAAQAQAFFAYVVPFTLFVTIAFRTTGGLARQARTRTQCYSIGASTLAAGFFVLTGLQYVGLFMTGHLPLPFEALNVIVAIQFVPLLAGLGVLAVYTIRRTGSYLPGGLIGGLFVTWYMVAGTATHVIGWPH